MNKEAEKMNKLIQEQFDGSMKGCAYTLGVAPSTISRIANGKNNPGMKLVKSIIRFCQSRNLEHELYVNLR